MSEESKITGLPPYPLEYKWGNRFQVILPEIFGIDSFLIKSITRPSYDLLNSRWSDIKIEFYDLVAPSTTKKLINLIKLGYDGLFGLNVVLNLLDSKGETIELWDISIKELVKVDLGSLHREMDFPLNTHIIFTPIKCVLKH